MKKALLGFIAAAGFMLASHTQAAVIDFDDLDAGGKLASIAKYNPYDGFTWTKWFLGDTSVAGYGNGAHSGTEFVMNGFGTTDLGVSSVNPFSFKGAWFVAPNINGTKASWVNIQAYDTANQLIGSTGNIAINGSFTWVGASFDNVSRVNITRDKGFFAMDDFTVRLRGEVPEPGLPALFAVALAALALARRKARP